MNLPYIAIDGYWVDDPSDTFEGYIIKQTHDVGFNDVDIFFYGLTYDEAVKSIGRKTALDFVITKVEIV